MTKIRGIERATRGTVATRRQRSSLPTRAMDPTPNPADIDAVRATNLAFYKAFEAGDLDVMAELWSAEAPISCLHPGWEPLSGRDAVLASWIGIFRGTKSIAFTLRNVQIFLAGDVAWVLLVEEIDATHADGGHVRAAAHATNVFVRESTGWKVVHHHAGPAVASQSPPAPERLLH